MLLSGSRLRKPGRQNQMLQLRVKKTRLQRLDLSAPKITDAGLEHLKGLTGLGCLDLSGTQVTEAGVQQLKQSLPELTIERGEAK